MKHQKSIKSDHVRRRNVPSPENEQISQRLTQLLSPAVWAQQAYYRQLGLRERILTLPLMVAVVLTLIWRQVPSVCELARLLNRQDLLWAKATQVSRQALAQRFLEFPASVFERVLQDLLPQLKQRCSQRISRPLPEGVVYALSYFERIWTADGSTLEALFRKLDSLQAVSQGQLAGKICTVIELTSRLPVKVWFHENPNASDYNFLDDLLNLAAAKTLLILDRGFYDFVFFARLIARQVDFITRLKSNAAMEVVKVLSSSYQVRDHLITLGTDDEGNPLLKLRLVEIRVGKVWYSYLTSVLNPEVLPPYVVADLYRRRWRIEEAFNLVKRLLGLGYLWTGSINGVKLQVWATWLVYAVLLDLGDAVAEQLVLPFDRISLEMVFRGLYHFHHAYSSGQATDPVLYLAAPENRDLGVVKAVRKRKRKPLPKLDLSPYPAASASVNSYSFQTA